MSVAIRIWLSVFALIFVAACTQTSPLSITLKDPKTNVVRKCAAREFGATHTELLAKAVETCARQLEEHGFVRVDE